MKHREKNCLRGLSDHRQVIIASQSAAMEEINAGIEELGAMSESIGQISIGVGE